MFVSIFSNRVTSIHLLRGLAEIAYAILGLGALIPRVRRHINNLINWRNYLHLVTVTFGATPRINTRLTSFPTVIIKHQEVRMVHGFSVIIQISCLNLAKVIFDTHKENSVVERARGRADLFAKTVSPESALIRPIALVLFFAPRISNLHNS